MADRTDLTHASTLAAIEQARAKTSEEEITQYAQALNLDDKNIFQLLKDNGPLSPAQLAVSTLLPVERVYEIIRELASTGVVEQRPDPGHEDADEFSMPWGLVRAFPYFLP